jgi:hypothetical protein
LSYLPREEAHVLTIDKDGYRVGIVGIARVGHEDSYQRRPRRPVLIHRPDLVLVVKLARQLNFHRSWQPYEMPLAGIV